MTRRLFATLLSLIIVASIVPLSVNAEQMGPAIDKVRFKVIKSPDPQLIGMQTGDVDVLVDLIRTGDIEKLDREFYTITSAPGFHMGFIAFNVRPNQTYKDSAHGSPIAGPVLSDANFRHALFHCYNQEEIVASIYKYVVTPVQSLVPPSLGGWQNPDVTKHPYNPGDPTADTEYDPVTKANADACSILRYGGYTWDAEEGNWMTPYNLDGVGGNDYIPDLKVFTPTYETAPTSAEHGHRWCEDCKSIGIPLIHEPSDFETYLDLVYGTEGIPGGEFDLYMVFYSLTRFPDHLYDMCHSQFDTRIAPAAYNGVGCHCDALDECVETIKFSLNHTEKMIAAYKAQEILYDPDTYPEAGCAWMLLYSRIYFNGFNKDMAGVVNSPGYGSDSDWTWLNWRWQAGKEKTENGDTIITYCLGEDPERLNPCFAHTVYAWAIAGTVLDGLIEVNPYTHADLPWLAESWTKEGPINETVTLDSAWYNGTWILLHDENDTIDLINGMKITYNLRSDVYWQDGNQYIPEDAEFNLEFFRNNRILRYLSTWENIVDVQKVNSTAFCVYVNETSQFLLYDIAGLSAYLPPPVWTRFDGEPMTTILGYDPSANTTAPDGAGPLFGNETHGCTTQLYGTGPYVFEFYDAPGGYADVHANRMYWRNTTGLQSQLAEMFHFIGDVDWNGEVWGEDKADYSLAYGCEGPDPPDPADDDWNANADLNGDNYVDASDGILISFYFGNKKEYP